MHCSQVHAKQIQKAIEKSAKQVIAASSIKTSTRSGSKELAHLIKRLACQPSANLATAAQMGEMLGNRVIEWSGKLGRPSLDQGVIRSLVLQKQIPLWTNTQPVTAAFAAAQMTANAAIEISPISQTNGNLTSPETVEAESLEINSTEASDEHLDAEATDELATDLEDENLDDEEIEEDLDDEDIDDEELDDEELDDEELDDEELDDEELDDEELDDEELDDEELDDEELDDEELDDDNIEAEALEDEFDDYESENELDAAIVGNGEQMDLDRNIETIESDFVHAQDEHSDQAVAIADAR